MKLLKVATCNLNQWAMDFDCNMNNIKESISRAKEASAMIRVGPELAITGYGCDVKTISWNLIPSLMHSISFSRRGNSLWTWLLVMGLFKTKWRIWFFASTFRWADSSSVAAIVGCMCHLVVKEIVNGDEQVKADAIQIGHYTDGQFPTDSKEFAKHIFYTVFMGSENRESL